MNSEYSQEYQEDGEDMQIDEEVMQMSDEEFLSKL
jgi:hypothetical protein